MRDPDWDGHCAGFIGEHYKKVTGKSLWRKIGHRCPRSPKEAAALYRKLGVTNLEDAATAVFGEPVDVAFAMRGDIVMVDNALGICRGELAEFMDRMQPIGRVERAWRITRNP